MEKERDSRVVYSQASLPPNIAIFSNTERLSRVNDSIGAEGMEILPFWGVWWEANIRGWLLDSAFITSFHQTWKVDTLLEKKAGVATRRSDRVIRASAFPPKSWTDSVMEQLWNYYRTNGIPTVVHAIAPETTLGHEDKYSFYLELAHQNAINRSDLVSWVGEKPELRGIVFPTRDDQFNDWKERYAKDREKFYWDNAASELLPNIRAVHLGPLTSQEIRSALKRGAGATPVEKRLISLYDMGFRGDAVIELDPRKLAEVAKAEGVGINLAYETVSRRFKHFRDYYSR